MATQKREFTEEEKKKLRIMEEERILRIYKEEFKPFWEEMSELDKSEIDLMKGIKYGLILGIFGNLLVQYSYIVFEGTLLERYDNMFLVSIGVVAVSILVIFITLLGYNKETKERQRRIAVATEALIREKYEIDEREVRLEALKQGLIKEDKTETKDTSEDKT